jgi:hypothetical protein
MMEIARRLDPPIQVAAWLNSPAGWPSVGPLTAQITRSVMPAQAGIQ